MITITHYVPIRTRTNKKLSSWIKLKKNIIVASEEEVAKEKYFIYMQELVKYRKELEEDIQLVSSDKINTVLTIDLYIITT